MLVTYFLCKIASLSSAKDLKKPGIPDIIVWGFAKFSRSLIQHKHSDTGYLVWQTLHTSCLTSCQTI